MLPALSRIPRPRTPPAFPGPLKTISIYAAATLLGIILFFTLHYIASRIPYDLVKQRFADEYAAHQTGASARYFQGERPLFDFEFCQISLMVMAGAHRDPSDNPLVDAISLRIIRKKVKPIGSYCDQLQAISNGAEVVETTTKARYWWGSNAAMSILLRFLSIYDIHRLILFATYMAWCLLALSLLLMGWRILLIAAPLIILGALLSGVGYFADIANGIPYLWTLLAASALTLLLLRPRTAQWAPLFCFTTGMLSAYLWLFDGHTALSIILIGLIAWLGYTRLKESAPIRRAAACLALYVAAFAICIALGQAAKVAVVEWATDYYPGWDVAQSFFETVSIRLDQTSAETIAGISGDDDAKIIGCKVCDEPGWQRLPVIRDIRSYWTMTTFGIPAGNLLGAYSALALVGAAAIAVWQARWGQRDLGRGLLWLGALALLASAHFFLPNDIPFRNARFAFLLLAICWTALALAVPQMDRRALTATAATAAICLAVAAGIAAYWHLDTAQVIAQSGDGNPPVIIDNFDVYYNSGRLIYVKENCNRVDTDPKFFLHIRPKNIDDLPYEQREIGFDNLDFNFKERQRWVLGKCVAVADLPDYGIASIRTGQHIPGAETVWGGEFPLALSQAEYAAITGGSPLARSVFDLYRHGNELAYVKESCHPADTQPRFFLHLIPQNIDDLPTDRQEHGFDNLNFDFGSQGALFNGKCLATIALPDYQIATIQTGQFTPNGSRIWEAEFPLR